MKRGALSGLAAVLVSMPPVVLSQTAAPDWISLQDGKSLAGWKTPERPEAWVVEDGMFVSVGDRSHLFYVGKVAKHDFHNFELSLDVMTSPGANSGVYVHTKWQGPGWPAAGYELQVINSNPPSEKMNEYVEHKMTGSVYAVRNTYVAPAKDNEWFNYRIRVVGKTIQTFVDDKLVAEYAEAANAPRAADKKGRLLGSGTFALQAHDPASVVKYRNIRVKLLPDDAAPPSGLVPIADRELDELVGWASDANIPLIDLGLSAPSGDATAFWSDVRRHGLTLGSELPAGALANYPASVLVVVDGSSPPNVDLLKAAKAAGAKVAFSGGGASSVDPARLKARLQAVKSAELGWKDFWVPGKN
ncbi:MAG: DUF1080 domain-containing protein [Steroidobacteraceae bacterium]|nr:DUF1080 domain-containing protein [Steroidobacteraceae bacterium]